MRSHSLDPEDARPSPQPFDPARLIKGSMTVGMLLASMSYIRIDVCAACPGGRSCRSSCVANLAKRVKSIRP